MLHFLIKTGYHYFSLGLCFCEIMTHKYQNWHSCRVFIYFSWCWQFLSVSCFSMYQIRRNFKCNDIRQSIKELKSHNTILLLLSFVKISISWSRNWDDCFWAWCAATVLQSRITFVIKTYNCAPKQISHWKNCTKLYKHRILKTTQRLWLYLYVNLKKINFSEETYNHSSVK